MSFPYRYKRWGVTKWGITRPFFVAVQGFLVFLHCIYARSVRDPRAGRSTRGGCVLAWLHSSHASTHPPLVSVWYLSLELLSIGRPRGSPVHIYVLRTTMLTRRP